MNVFNWLTLVAVVFSAASAVRHIQLIFQDRKSLGITGGGPLTKDPNKKSVMLHIVNAGKRRIKLLSIQGRKKRGFIKKSMSDFCYVPEGFECILEESDSITVKIQEPISVFFLSGEYKHIFIFDSQKKEWKIPNKEITKMKRQNNYDAIKSSLSIIQGAL